VRHRRPILAQRNVAECIEPKFKDMVQRAVFSVGVCDGSFNPLRLPVRGAPQSDGRNVDFVKYRTVCVLYLWMTASECLNKSMFVTRPELKSSRWPPQTAAFGDTKLAQIVPAAVLPGQSACAIRR
jgi:hypothetical protein